ncbi:hypothetical protein ACFQV2_39905 [Actinokineospora soli]|uniref:Sigma-70, region 4 n=1 Tax=Actinokineospora soli TaxID=1048753 RepID=A0ABW2U099_9PSEU
MNDRPPTLDVRAALDSADEKQLRAMIDVHGDRARWGRIASDPNRAAVAEAALADVPAVTALEALAATTRLLTLMTGRRWITIMQAREDGATWAEVGEAMGTDAETARSWYAEKIAAQRRHLPDLHDSSRAEAVL